MRAAAVTEFRTRAGRAAGSVLREWLEEDGKGYECVVHMSWLEDELIRAIHRFVTHHMYQADNPSSGERIAIAATGGYGRGTLAPGSDIDLLFLLPYKKTAWSESVIEAILYFLWDLRQKVGHATRSVDECLRQARDDMTIRTSLLEARFILGDETLFEDMRTRFDDEVVRKTAAEFVSAKLAERDARVARAGASRYLVEPNIKEGKGGLRDLNTLFWISKYVYRVRDAEELVKAGLFTAARVPHVPQVRGIPLDGALAPAFHHRPRRGAPHLRLPAPDRAAARLRHPRRPVRRRALHEALFPRRQGRRRPHRHRLRRARGEAGQAARHARPLHGRAETARAEEARRRRLRGGDRSHHRREPRTCSSAIRSISSASTGWPSATPCRSIPTRRASSRCR